MGANHGNHAAANICGKPTEWPRFFHLIATVLCAVPWLYGVYISERRYEIAEELSRLLSSDALSQSQMQEFLSEENARPANTIGMAYGYRDEADANEAFETQMYDFPKPYWLRAAVLYNTEHEIVACAKLIYAGSEVNEFPFESSLGWRVAQSWPLPALSLIIGALWPMFPQRWRPDNSAAKLAKSMVCVTLSIPLIVFSLLGMWCVLHLAAAWSLS